MHVCAADADTIDFDGFLRLLKVASSTDHLDQVGVAPAPCQLRTLRCSCEVRNAPCSDANPSLHNKR